jgi:hypothetical protein
MPDWAHRAFVCPVGRWIESFLDVISSSVVYYGLRLAIKPPDKDHPYGHGKADPIAAAVVGCRHDRGRNSASPRKAST